MKLDFDKCRKVTKPDFLKKMCLQNIRLFVSKIGVFGHFLEIASLDFANFAYYIRKQWYLTDLGGSSLQKKYLRLLWPMKACLQINFLSPKSLSCLILKSFFSFYILWSTTMISSWYWWFQSSKIFFRSKLSPFWTCLQIIFVSKFIFSTFTHMLLFILHILR